MISTNYTVNATAQLILTSSPSARTVYLHVEGNGIVYLGNSTVTTTTGTPLAKHTSPVAFFIPPHETLYAVNGEGGEDLRVLRPSKDAN